MSAGRKILRFLNWFEDIKGMYYYIIYKNTSIRNIFKALMSLSSFFYHIFDNLVWTSSVGLISEYLIGDIKLKNTKNLFSLFRNLIKIIMDFYKFKSLYFINSKNEEEVLEVFDNKVENFKTEAHNRIVTQTLQIRLKLRLKILDLVHSFLRINMLLYSLRIEPFYSNLHPIFIGLCGMTHSLISIYKSITVINESRHFNSSKNEEKNNKSTLDMIMEDNVVLNKQRIFEKDYFDNYYLDFNKDYPTEPSKVLAFNDNKVISDDIY
jgi:hypothetical protein